jgi:hypothetical protein
MKRIAILMAAVALTATTPAFALCEPDPRLHELMAAAVGSRDPALIYAAQAQMQMEQQRCMFEVQIRLQQQQQPRGRTGSR